MISAPATRRWPWQAETRQAWSLLDMIEFLGHSFVSTIALLKEVQMQYATHAYGEGAATQLDAGQRKHVHYLVRSIESECEAMGLTHSTLAARTLINHVLDHPTPICNYASTYAGIYSLLSHVSSDLATQRFVFIPPETHKYFSPRSPLAPNVRPLPSSFPPADEDMEHAGNAYAVGLHTATVFYLMRAAEIGLRAFAKHLHVRLPRKKGPVEWAQWEDILKALQKKIDVLAVKRGTKPQKSANRAFYRGLLTEFEGFKDMYRNDVMHVRQTYTKTDAESALERVGEFLQRLGTRIHE